MSLLSRATIPRTSRLLCALALLAGRPAWALDWWVADEAERARLEASLATLWPDAPVELRVGAPPDGAPGLRSEGDELVWFERGETRRGTAADAATQVALARSWSRTTTTPSSPGCSCAWT